MANIISNCEPSHSPSTLVELLRWRGTQQRDRVAFIYLQDGEAEKERLTYGELDRRARALAGLLQQRGLADRPALLLYPSGLDYVVAFFGCLYARTLAVPAYPPHRNRSLDRLQAIAADAGAGVVLSTASILASVQKVLPQAPDLQGLPWITTDKLPEGTEEHWHEPEVKPDTLAFLQYTSGSTSSPRGVMISHANLLHNSALIAAGAQPAAETRPVFWLPLYHDMGLIGGVIQPIYLNAPGVLMAPVSFLSSPYRWLKAITHYRGTTSAAPNFAFDLCVRKITPEQRATLDLSSWELAFCGAEPISSATLERFTETFKPHGFRAETFYPCYGLAEGTLIVSGGRKDAPPVTLTVEKVGLEQGRSVPAAAGNAESRTLVGCGQTLMDQKIVIADPQTLRTCPPGVVGEVWVMGPSVSRGYWNKPEQTERTFRASLADTGEGPFLRTGDLGFLHSQAACGLAGDAAKPQRPRNCTSPGG